MSFAGSERNLSDDQTSTAGDISPYGSPSRNCDSNQVAANNGEAIDSSHSAEAVQSYQAHVGTQAAQVIDPANQTPTERHPKHTSQFPGNVIHNGEHANDSSEGDVPGNAHETHTQTAPSEVIDLTNDQGEEPSQDVEREENTSESVIDLTNETDSAQTPNQIVGVVEDSNEIDDSVVLSSQGQDVGQAQPAHQAHNQDSPGAHIAPPAEGVTDLTNEPESDAHPAQMFDMTEDSDRANGQGSALDNPLDTPQPHQPVTQEQNNTDGVLQSAAQEGEDVGADPNAGDQPVSQEQPEKSWVDLFGQTLDMVQPENGEARVDQINISAPNEEAERTVTPTPCGPSSHDTPYESAGANGTAETMRVSGGVRGTDAHTQQPEFATPIQRVNDEPTSQNPANGAQIALTHSADERTHERGEKSQQLDEVNASGPRGHSTRQGTPNGAQASAIPEGTNANTRNEPSSLPPGTEAGAAQGQFPIPVLLRGSPATGDNPGPVVQAQPMPPKIQTTPPEHQPGEILPMGDDHADRMASASAPEQVVGGESVYGNDPDAVTTTVQTNGINTQDLSSEDSDTQLIVTSGVGGGEVAPNIHATETNNGAEPRTVQPSASHQEHQNTTQSLLEKYSKWKADEFRSLDLQQVTVVTHRDTPAEVGTWDIRAQQLYKWEHGFLPSERVCYYDTVCKLASVPVDGTDPKAQNWAAWQEKEENKNCVVYVGQKTVATRESFRFQLENIETGRVQSGAEGVSYKRIVKYLAGKEKEGPRRCEYLRIVQLDGPGDDQQKQDIIEEVNRKVAVHIKAFDKPRAGAENTGTHREDKGTGGHTSYQGHRKRKGGELA